MNDQIISEATINELKDIQANIDESWKKIHELINKGKDNQQQPMSKLKSNEYQCAMCKGIFNKGQTDEEAMAEAKETFGTQMAMDDCDVICDDCYQRINPADHPDELNAAKEEFHKIKSN